jgi:DNA-binding NtrC family response regulator
LEDQLDTNTEGGSSDGFSPERAWLLYLGAAEDGFVHAGRIFELEGISKVRFGRSLVAGQLEHEEKDGVLYLGVPIGWVSGVHCEMRVVHRTITPDFDLQDLNSRNGTHIEGEPTSGKARLPVGAVFEVGRSFWMVQKATSAVAIDSMRHNAAPLELETLSPALRHIAAALERLAPSAVSILISGETGTGKERLARRVHDASGRKGKFVRAHLGAFSASRLESLLFGDVEAGGTLLEAARGGTLFLENVGELSEDAQLKFLSAVTEVLPGYDIRLICSTVGDLRGQTEDNRFRGDLFSRIAGFEVVVPPLRDRREDLGTLVKEMVAQTPGSKELITTKAFRRLLSARWPFNLRQLGQTLTAASILTSEDGGITRELVDEVLGGGDSFPDSPSDIQVLREQLIRELSDHGGDVTAVALALGRERREVDQWLTRFDLVPTAYRH